MSKHDQAKAMLPNATQIWIPISHYLAIILSVECIFHIVIFTKEHPNFRLYPVNGIMLSGSGYKAKQMSNLHFKFKHLILH